jgi:hypothetical protein
MYSAAVSLLDRAISKFSSAILLCSNKLIICLHTHDNVKQHLADILNVVDSIARDTPDQDKIS